MAELKVLLLSAGFHNVQTYIQSGNIFLKSEQEKLAVQSKIEEIILQHFQVSTPCFTLTIQEIQEALIQNPFQQGQAANQVFFTYLEAEPSEEAISTFLSFPFQPDQVKIDKQFVYTYLPEGMGKSKLTNNFIEQKLKVKATGRNLNTIQKMCEIARQYN